MNGVRTNFVMGWMTKTEEKKTPSLDPICRCANCAYKPNGWSYLFRHQAVHPRCRITMFCDGVPATEVYIDPALERIPQSFVFDGHIAAAHLSADIEGTQFLGMIKSYGQNEDATIVRISESLLKANVNDGPKSSSPDYLIRILTPSYGLLLSHLKSLSLTEGIAISMACEVFCDAEENLAGGTYRITIDPLQSGTAKNVESQVMEILGTLVAFKPLSYQADKINHPYVSGETYRSVVINSINLLGSVMDPEFWVKSKNRRDDLFSQLEAMSKALDGYERRCASSLRNLLLSAHKEVQGRSGQRAEMNPMDLYEILSSPNVLTLQESELVIRRWQKND